MAIEVTSEDEVERLIKFRNTVIFENTRLPAMLFKPDYKLFRYFDEAQITDPELFNAIMILSRHLSTDKVLSMAIDPNQKEYYKRYHSYGTYILDSSSYSYDEKGFIRDTSENDISYARLGPITVIIPIEDGIPDWCVYLERKYCEIGIIAFKNNDIMNIFLNIIDNNKIGDEQDALGLISLGWGGGRMPEEFKLEFLKNYNKL